MNWKKYRTLFTLLIIAPILAGFHMLIVKSLVSAEIYEAFHYSLPMLYCLFTAASAVILLISIIMKQRGPEQIGNVFLITTSVKMALCYALIQPVLNTDTQSAHFEKINFFVIFILFLAIEVLLTSRLLNDGNEKGKNS
ncbi:hypothetical protein FEDK69T_06410 [Flavobacterium enshiense DK69]|uniref:Uncharacterized protein n=1 Tax=Flavobacterium enshiense DK69 TaxID=1107311 RepID=V6SCN0_9FLAO|nr:hypothetical protein [Flavobacterium enshiense]ESU24204.1 hypothetical protein FEDK69T_06410 [Flavobacterium enshiense DK69]KGO95419.1 hypothetical protein Q767_11495 [Flavobacterium enshiense DK69]